MKRMKGISRGSKILLFLVIIVASAVGFGFHYYMSAQSVTVFLYNDNYIQGKTITKDMFASTQIDLKMYNLQNGTGNKYSTSDDILQYIEAGDTLAVGVAKYTAAISNQFVSTGGTGIESRLTKNMVSVELLVDKVSGLSADVRVGSRLNLISGCVLDKIKQSDMLFQNVSVIDVIKNSDNELYSVYVEVTPVDSIRLIHSLSFETITASIIKPGSYAPLSEGDTLFVRDYELGATGQVNSGEGLEQQQAQQVPQQ
jgi:hypothetical protein